MPTIRRRHTLTETDAIAHALDAAAIAWPELRGDRAALLYRLVEAGAATVWVDGGARGVIRDAAGAASGTYPRDARTGLLAEWPD
jgi:hypothetical protein